MTDDLERLERLRQQWGELYNITALPWGPFRARLRERGAEPIDAPTLRLLENLIRADYATRTGPR